MEDVEGKTGRGSETFTRMSQGLTQGASKQETSQEAQSGIYTGHWTARPGD